MREEKNTDKWIDFAGLKRSEAKRSEAEQSESPAKSTLTHRGDSFPDPEVRVRNGRRRCPSSYKAKRLKEAEACASLGVSRASFYRYVRRNTVSGDAIASGAKGSR